MLDSSIEVQKKLKDYLALSGLKKSYDRGEVLISPDTKEPALYYVITGQVVAYTITEDANKSLRYIYKPGEMFSLHSAILDRPPRGYYETLNKVRLYKVNIQEFNKYVDKHPDILKYLLTKALEHGAAYSSVITSLSYVKARKRVISRLINFAARFGRHLNNEIIISIPLRHHELAGTANVSRETASRTLEKLTLENIISKRDGLIVILDIERLKRELDYSNKN